MIAILKLLIRWCKEIWHNCCCCRVFYNTFYSDNKIIRTNLYMASEWSWRKSRESENGRVITARNSCRWRFTCNFLVATRAYIKYTIMHVLLQQKGNGTKAEHNKNRSQEIFDKIRNLISFFCNKSRIQCIRIFKKMIRNLHLKGLFEICCYCKTTHRRINCFTEW